MHINVIDSPQKKEKINVIDRNFKKKNQRSQNLTLGWYGETVNLHKIGDYWNKKELSGTWARSTFSIKCKSKKNVKTERIYKKNMAPAWIPSLIFYARKREKHLNRWVQDNFRMIWMSERVFKTLESARTYGPLWELVGNWHCRRSGTKRWEGAN